MGLSLSVQAQSNLQEVLQSVAINNLSLKAQNQYIETQRIGYKTELNLANPEFEYENSFSDTEGKPYEILISQSFDFPTVYWHKNKIKKAKIANLDNLLHESRQEILLGAQKICLSLIYQNKLKLELVKRYENAQKLVSFFQKKLAQGDANILEMNKVKIVLLNTKNQMQLCNTRIANLNEELKLINGGKPIEYKTDTYPEFALEENYSKLEMQVLNGTPGLNTMKANKDIASKEIALAKNQSLPKFSLGYRYINSDISKAANGFKFGISIPLWENRNKVKYAKLKEMSQESQFLAQEKIILSDLRKHYQNYQGLKASLAEYRVILEGSNMNVLLQKALDYGQISSIEYFMESIYFYDSYDTYLEIEKEYNLALANLLKYQIK